MIIRKFHPSDLEQVLALFYHTVHAINKKHYPQEQLDAWAPKNPDKNKWLEKLFTNHTFVAVVQEKIVGFADVSSDGLLDHLYVHKDFQGQSIASALLKKIEEQANNFELTTLLTYASTNAKPFFIKQGFIVKQRQQVTRKGIKLTNYLMVKKI